MGVLFFVCVLFLYVFWVVLFFGFFSQYIYIFTLTQIMREETCCCHMGYSFQLARIVLYAPTYRQDITYHDLCKPVVEHWLEREIAQWVHHEISHTTALVTPVREHWVEQERQTDKQTHTHKLLPINWAAVCMSSLIRKISLICIRESMWYGWACIRFWKHKITNAKCKQTHTKQQHCCVMFNYTQKDCRIIN